MLRTISSIGGLAFVLVGCGTDPYAGESSGTWTPTSTTTGTSTGIIIATDYSVTVAPLRKLDLVFMIDNSPGMAGKLAKMTSQFSRLLSALKDPSDGTYPDLRIAIIDSDLGTGGAYTSGSCGPSYSNDQSQYGDLGNFQTRGATSCGLTSAESLWLEYTKGIAVNYLGDITSVFSCLATNTGTVGCGEEHSLQAFEFALVAQNLHVGQYANQSGFLRSEAYLGLVFLTDEDDCSAGTNDGMFGDKAELLGESASLRCATRGHRCDGFNLADLGPGYPTTAAFTTDFIHCAARTDSCPNTADGKGSTDTSIPTPCSPLKSVASIASELKALKDADEKILVAGIFGWPRKGSDGNPDFTGAQYRIDRVPNPNSADTAHPEVYDYWPVCYDPDHLPKSSGFEAEAWGYGAMGGLRLSSFVDAFGTSGLKYSICERDFSDAMQGIGGALARKMANRCVSSSIDAKACTAHVMHPTADGTRTVTYVADAASTPKCAEVGAPVIRDCYTVVSDPTLCPGAQYVIQLNRTEAEIAAGPLDAGTKLRLSCK